MTMMISGYLYWFILSLITSPSNIGTSSTVISFITIFMAIASIGVSGGIQGFLGKNIVTNKLGSFRTGINASLIIISIGIIGTSIAILLLKDWVSYSFDIDFNLIAISILITALMVLASLLRSIIIPSLKTKIITISSILATAMKLSITVVLLFYGLGVTGILIGFAFYPIISTIILFISINKAFYKKKNISDETQNINLFKVIKTIFFSSIAFWIPGIINIIGSQLGTIFVFMSEGAHQAGIYFIAFSIVTGIITILSVLSTIAYPTISSMKDGRKRAVWRLIKISLIFTAPLSIILIFYSSEILGLFGKDYATGARSLQILLVSVIPTAISSGIGVLSYSYGNNKQVLIIGLLTSIPRALLYIVFVPLFSTDGAAYTYLIGSILGLFASLLIGKRNGLKIIWKELIFIITIPAGLLLINNIIKINYIIYIIITICISFILFLKLNTINKEDIEDILNILPNKISDHLYFITKIAKR